MSVIWVCPRLSKVLKARLMRSSRRNASVRSSEVVFHPRRSFLLKKPDLNCRFSFRTAISGFCLYWRDLGPKNGYLAVQNIFHGLLYIINKPGQFLKAGDGRSRSRRCKSQTSPKKPLIIDNAKRGLAILSRLGVSFLQVGGFECAERERVGETLRRPTARLSGLYHLWSCRE